MSTLCRKLVGFFTGFYIIDSILYLRQSTGWIAFPKAEILAVKFKTASHVIIRYKGGKHVVVDLFSYSKNNWVYRGVFDQLTDGLEKIQHKHKSGSWTYIKHE